MHIWVITIISLLYKPTLWTFMREKEAATGGVL